MSYVSDLFDVLSQATLFYGTLRIVYHVLIGSFPSPVLLIDAFMWRVFVRVVCAIALSRGVLVTMAVHFTPMDQGQLSY